MANIIIRPNHLHRAFHALALFISFLLLIHKGGAYEFRVGGSIGWTVPPDSNALYYNQWAESNRFQIGDTIRFVYPAGKDSVLYVTNDDYTNCNTATYLKKASDGNTLFQFNESGPFYFISGDRDNCNKNEKMVVVVMADRSTNTNQTTIASPPPPPVGSSEFVPTPPPSPYSPSAASSMLLSFIGSIGAFVATISFLLN
ncbi:early nodulin-like protein 9 [Cornus florida]|uniref:early nodulin-like protein 9 n=1 Tax=Cornus florida TaxID=4283 RepID=UPI00289AD0C4|nr:early nodulin-like protein 9 [Cornus florida]